MHEKNPRPERAAQPERPIAQREHETPPPVRPQIYVASLADYNNGILHGQWMDAARDPEDIHADIAAMLARSRQPDAEEFAIHDFEQFGTCRIHEYDAIELVSRIARGIQEHGLAFAAWAEVHESTPERFDDFAAAYLGHYGSVEDYAEQIADDLGYHDEIDTIPASLRPYVRIDTAAMGRDMESSGDISVAPDPDGGVWVFDGRA